MQNQRTIATQWLERAQEELEIEARRKARDHAGMSEEQLMQLRKQIEATKQRGNAGENVRERLLELRRSHFRGSGADGG